MNIILNTYAKTFLIQLLINKLQGNVNEKNVCVVGKMLGVWIRLQCVNSNLMEGTVFGQNQFNYSHMY